MSVNLVEAFVKTFKPYTFNGSKGVKLFNFLKEQQQAIDKTMIPRPDYEEAREKIKKILYDSNNIYDTNMPPFHTADEILKLFGIGAK